MRFVARKASLYIEDSSGASKSLSGRLNSIELNWTAETPEVTSFGATTRERVPDGLMDWELSIEGYVDLASGDIDETLSGIVGGSTLFQLGPTGSDSGALKYAACAICSEYDVSLGVEDAATFSATFVPRTGSLTRATWA